MTGANSKVIDEETTASGSSMYGGGVHSSSGNYSSYHMLPLPSAAVVDDSGKSQSNFVLSPYHSKYTQNASINLSNVTSAVFKSEKTHSIQHLENSHEAHSLQTPPWLNTPNSSPVNGKPHTTLSPRLSGYKSPSHPSGVMSSSPDTKVPPFFLAEDQNVHYHRSFNSNSSASPNTIVNSSTLEGSDIAYHPIAVKYHQKQPLMSTALPSHRHGGQKGRGGATGMQSSRQSPQKFSGVCFLVIVIHIIVFQYATYASLLLRPLVFPHFTSFGLAIVIVFHILFGLTLWTFVQCVITDPGAVPPNWGFYMGDKNKRRRYCQVCNIWKPDRTHHCSACDRCILNMDHHCPWINNCVGFYNRKFFIQLLCSTLASLIFVSIHGFAALFVNGFDIGTENDGLKPFSSISGEGFRSSTLDIVPYCLICIMLFIAVALAFPLVPFLRFHLGLITRNSTTIESMPSAIDVRQGGVQARPSYDIGTRRNVEQVLGKYVICWWLPMHTASSRPVGDGVRWRQSYLTAIDEDSQQQQRS